LPLNLPVGTWSKQIDSADAQWKGRSALPEKLEGGNAVQLTLQPRSFVIYEQSNEALQTQKS
jgi:hypothetical protein